MTVFAARIGRSSGEVRTHYANPFSLAGRTNGRSFAHPRQLFGLWLQTDGFKR
jgi:hypothetical protein